MVIGLIAFQVIFLVGSSCVYAATGRSVLGWGLLCLKSVSGWVLTEGPGGSLLSSQAGCLSLAMATGARGIALGSGFWFSVRSMANGLVTGVGIRGARRQATSPPSWPTKKNKDLLHI
ncbi:hypothetical protein TIFTF001_003789 [Ficus carica]|uniref:Uncharacterized protein n=1 Tax=Ficus carica TaxID=3494 RepID=A0AA88DBB7_FICCA|nr:hypothetical protein TIFTF001_003789 [Ficus carica]